MKRKALLMLLAAALALALLGCGGAELRAVERCAEQYLQTFQQDGIEKAVAYCHFEANDVYSQDEHGGCMSAPAAPFRTIASAASTRSTTGSMP